MTYYSVKTVSDVSHNLARCHRYGSKYNTISEENDGMAFTLTSTVKRRKIKAIRRRL